MSFLNCNRACQDLKELFNPMAQLNYIGENITKYGGTPGFKFAGNEAWKNFGELSIGNQLAAGARTAFISYSGENAGKISPYKIGAHAAVSGAMTAAVTSRDD